MVTCPSSILIYHKCTASFYFCITGQHQQFNLFKCHLLFVKHCRLGSPNLSDTEKTVLHQLTGMGITEEMMRQDINLGVRSPIIATYRIMLHKAMLRTNNTSTNSLKSSKYQSDIKHYNTKVSPAPIVGKVQNFQGPKTPKSKTCVMLWKFLNKTRVGIMLKRCKFCCKSCKIVIPIYEHLWYHCTVKLENMKYKMWNIFIINISGHLSPSV